MKPKTARIVRVPGRRMACVPMFAVAGGASVSNPPGSGHAGASSGPPRLRPLRIFAVMHSTL